MNRPFAQSVLIASLGAGLSVAGEAHAVLGIDQSPSRLLRERDNTYFQLFGFEPVTSIRSVTATGNGGFLVNAKTGFSFGDNYPINPPDPQLAKDHIFGDVDGLAGDILQREDTVPFGNLGGTDYYRVQFSNAIGYNPSNGNLVYGADIDTMPDAPNDDDRLSALFVGDTAVFVEGDNLPSGSGFAGAVSQGVNYAGSAGDTAFYTASYTGGGVTNGRGLFSTAGEVLYYTGQSLGASGNSIQDKSLSVGNTRVSDNGGFYVVNADVGVGTSQEALVINGQVATTPTGTFFREGDPIVSGGTELLDDINQIAVNNSGKWAASGWTDAASNEDGIFIDGEMVYREGDILPKAGGGFGLPLFGLPAAVDVNNDGDVAFYFGGKNESDVFITAIVVNGVVVVEAGDTVENTTFDRILQSQMSLSDRDASGVVDLFFEAVDNTAFNSNSGGLYHMALQLPAPVVPGDTDGDGDIDDADLGTSFANYTGPQPFGTGGKTPATGDTDGDGDVDDADLGTSFAGYTGPLAPATIPEPAAALLILPTLMACARRRRRA